MEKIGFVSLGCSKNLIDTEVMLGILRDRHMEITEDLAQSDIIIVNTCTFIEKAKQESIDTILQAARYKTEGNCKILIVTGCLSQQYKEELMKEMPEIDALLGTGSWDRIWEAIDTVKKGRKACFIDDVSHLYDQHTSRMRTTISRNCTGISLSKKRSRPRRTSARSSMRRWTRTRNNISNFWITATTVCQRLRKILPSKRAL